MTTTAAPPATGADAAGAAAPAPPPPLTVTPLNHQPLPPVWAYTFSVWLPAGKPGTAAPKPDAAQYGLPVAAATSGRDCANDALASIRPPPSMVPNQTWTSSAPAQPWAVISTNQPATV